MYVNVYELDRHYGGPEEGGWWFDSGEIVKSVEVPTSRFWTSDAFYAHEGPDVLPTEIRAELQKVLAELEAEYPSEGNIGSVAYRGGVFRVRIEDAEGKDWPEEVPHYE